MRINTGDLDRDQHLKSKDFFDGEQYPGILFKSTRFKKLSDKKYVVTGDLTIKGVTRNVNFDVDYKGVVNVAKNNAQPLKQKVP